MTESQLTILSFIRDGLNYPYIMEKILEKRNLRDYFDLSFSSIYFLVNTLEKNRYIETYSAFCKKGLKKRGVKMTENGEEAFLGSLKDSFKARPLLSHPLDYSLVNCHHLSGEELRNGLNTYIKEVERILKFYEQTRQEKLDSEERISLGEKLLLSHFIIRLKADLEWAREARSEIQSIKDLDRVLSEDRAKLEELYRTEMIETS
jgi:DNA-binding PadR family transcriptional regulator